MKHKKFEYIHTELPIQKFPLMHMNEMGQQGWDLCYMQGRGESNWFFWTREILDEA